MSSQANSFFKHHQLPVIAHLSADTKQALENYLITGNQTLRERKLLEFLKSVDWLTPSELSVDRFWLKMEPALKRKLGQDLDGYRRAKQDNRAESAEKREQYKLRVFEYFRQKIPAQDKALLESLRDFELNLTGRDINWRHYFTLDSFKKIDAFVSTTSEERQTLFTQFKKDVETYKKNYDKIYEQGLWEDSHNHFTFDDWCDWFGESPDFQQHQKQQKRQSSNQASMRNDTAVSQAYAFLQLPFNTAQPEAKKQFRKLTLQYHPDVSTGSEEKMKQLVAAYQTLETYWKTLSMA